MLETTPTVAVHSLPESPPQGDQMEKGLPMTGMEAFWMTWGALTTFLIVKSDWRGLWK